MSLDTICPYCGGDTALRTTVPIASEVEVIGPKILEKEVIITCPYCEKKLLVVERYRLDDCITTTYR